MQHAVNCLRLRKLSEYCTRFHPKDRPDAKYIVNVLTNEDLSNGRNLPLTVNQGTCIENATSSYVPGDRTNGCAFLSVVFGEHLLCQNERSTVATFKKLPALLRKSSSIPLFNSIPLDIKVGITTYRRLMEFCRNVKC